MVRSAAGGGGHAQDGHDAALALARLSSSLKPATQPVAGVLSVRALLFMLVVLLSLGVLIPIVSRSKHDLEVVATLHTTVHSVPRMPRTANLHLGQVNWKRYTLRQAAQVRGQSLAANLHPSSSHCIGFDDVGLHLLGFWVFVGSGERWRAHCLHRESALS